ncbi:Tim44 domain-containing protein [Undibacterium sp. RuRC25W]|uniref:Tim44 domain-containing protein n=1 Tax=Undibacterium sp. RuRC25W TaxID=3413047 RepID=UPI003BF302AF
MKKFLIAMVMVASTLAMTMHDADAKRMGGGSSVGRQSNNVSRQAAPATPANNSFNQPRPAAPAAAPVAPPAPMVPPKPASPWKGVVGGLIGGALLGAAFSHFGFGGAAAGMLGSLFTFALIAFAIMFIIRLFRGKNTATASATRFDQPAYAGANSTPTSDIGSRFDSQPVANTYAAPAPAASAATWSIPADFDVPVFLRNAKTYFIRLQAAWDKADINDLREFTTPEMYAELKLEIQERGATLNVTDVVSIEAELLGVENAGNDHLASVKFTGMIKEAQNAPAEPFSEVWNLSKPVNGQGGWVLAGIQQL